MHNLWEKAKAHPAIAGLIVAGVGLLFVILLFGGNKSGGTAIVAPVADTSDAANATALQMANINAGVQVNATQASLTAALAALAAQSHDTDQSANVALANIAATADTTKFVADLQAKVMDNQTAATKAMNDANTSAAVQISTIQAGADQTIAGLNAAYASLVSNNALDAANKQTAAALQASLAQTAAAQDVAKYQTNERQFEALITQNIALRQDNTRQTIASWLIGAGYGQNVAA